MKFELNEMLNPVNEINILNEFQKKFTFCTLVTNEKEYLQMVESAQNIGFVGEDVEFIYFNNKKDNCFDGYSGVNHAIRNANGEYLIFCHQDLLFKYDDRADLELCLQELAQLDPNWALAGNAGRDGAGLAFVRITDPHGVDQRYGTFPHEVISLDENFIIINRKKNIACTASLSGFHFYGTDLCQNAKILGLKSYVIDFHLHHKSGGKIDENYKLAKESYIELQCNRKKSQFYSTSCSNFFVSSNKMLNYIFNKKFFLKLLRSLHKRKTSRWF